VDFATQEEAQAVAIASGLPGTVSQDIDRTNRIYHHREDSLNGGFLCGRYLSWRSIMIHLRVVTENNIDRSKADKHTLRAVRAVFCGFLRRGSPAL
jgi:hypothetical protein